MASTILITGGMGFIGSHLIRTLNEKGYGDIVVLDNLTEQIHGKNPEQTEAFKTTAAKVRFIKGCVTDRELLLQALQGVDTVVHLAAETGTGQSMYEIKRYADVNIGGTALLLDLLANEKGLKVKKVVVASSRSIYGEGRYQVPATGAYVYPAHRQDAEMRAGNFEVTYPGVEEPLRLVPTDEQSQIHPSSVYGITKQNQEQMVMTVCPAIGIAPVAFRYQNVYGPGQSLSNPYTGILSIFSTLIRNGKGINIFEDGLESRDFVYVQDVVDATIAGIEQEAANGQVFNVGSGVGTTVMQVAQTLKKAYGIDVPLTISGNYRIGDIRHNIADLGKIGKMLAFQPKVSFEQGIAHFCTWVMQQDVEKNNLYDQSINEMKEKGLLK
ncbi:NAD-dependent epimerase/dehydratase family protein [Taibaiella chishuiensis]|uniref:dTDP-L-rhamnose 4-epimerase n=1 Tax=Taibaiella chishuiensis TaxID=1434707 RepID=A0A2P8DB72_9BACT|nr:NAD-dependent epimerase/dehydratase family protein [Taibaiella chishuiensis]PSK94459.1 dTDP-L-rhamnose 4-epimerase [Taibaiella chishuiensis]